ncbi:MAG TPA: pentapeptide repeat-containing protein, partial [Caproiciproducens sp.]|nr:pentapeptide repeat-containing protein [Caproiciproducens sp.]
NFAEATFDHVGAKDCNCRLVNLSSSKMKNAAFDHVDFTGGSFQQCGLKTVAFRECRLIQAEFLHTPLKGIDFTSSEIGGILLSGEELRGAIVTPLQACDLSRFLGLVVR